MPERLLHAGCAPSGVAGEALIECVELGGVGRVVVAVEVQVEDAAGAGDRARARTARRAFVRAVDVLIAVAVAVAGFLVDGELDLKLNE